MSTSVRMLGKQQISTLRNSIISCHMRSTSGVVVADPQLDNIMKSPCYYRVIVCCPQCCFVSRLVPFMALGCFQYKSGAHGMLFTFSGRERMVPRRILGGGEGFSHKALKNHFSWLIGQNPKTYPFSNWLTPKLIGLVLKSQINYVPSLEPN